MTLPWRRYGIWHYNSLLWSFLPDSYQNHHVTNAIRALLNDLALIAFKSVEVLSYSSQLWRVTCSILKLFVWCVTHQSRGNLCAVAKIKKWEMWGEKWNQPSKYVNFRLLFLDTEDARLALISPESRGDC